MPLPQPQKGEKQNDYMGRCMHKINKDNPEMENKQQVAICLNTFSKPKTKSKANEIEVDFSDEIKKININKEETVKNEEVFKKINPPPNDEPQAIVETKVKNIEAKAENNNGEIIQTTLLQMQHQYKILHWQTQSFSQHKSFDEIVSSLSDNIDEFIETYMGKYGRVIAAGTFNITLANYKDADFNSITDSYINFMISLNNALDTSKDSDLLNIRDEMLGSLNQLKYLLTLI